MNRCRRHPRGFSLVEVTLALGVVAFCMVVLFGLLPVGFNSNSAALEQTAAASIAISVIADLRQTPSTAGTTAAATSPRFFVPVPDKTSDPLRHTLYFNEEGATASPTAATVDQDAQASQAPRYRATLFFTPPATSTDRTATTVRVLVTWPALADATAGAIPSRFAGSFETVVALDRN